MRLDGRLSRMLHVLLHMGRREDPLTSETIAKMLGTNPGVIRRTMAGLRDSGYVAAEKGHGGGWTLRRPLAEITLWEVYRALGAPRLFALGNPTDSGICPLERVAEAALDEGFAAASAAFGAHLKEITLAELFAQAEGQRPG